MPGIYGVAGNNYLEKSVQGMATSMFFNDHLKQDLLYSDEYVGGSRTHTGHIGEPVSPVRLGSRLIWVEGEAYNISEVTSELNIKATTLSELLLMADREVKLNKCLNRLDGDFCAAIFDSDQKKIKLISDRYGMRMLYWYHKDGMIAWGAEVKTILAIDGVDKKIDPISFDCFMDLGHLMGEHTWFDYIKLIKPATILEYDMGTGEVRHDHYWNWSEIRTSNLSFDEAVDELGKRFIEAVSRRFSTRERIGIALSGGVDSRAIFAAVDHLYPDFSGYAYTFGIPGCDDITIAAQVVARSKWRHEKFHFTKDNWFETRFSKVWNSDGMLDMMHMHGTEFSEEISKHIDVNLNGYLGDAVLGGSYLGNSNWLNSRINQKIAASYYEKYAEGYDDGFYSINHYDNYLYMSRGRRFINAGTANALSWCDQRKPFFDNKIIELIFSLPDNYRLNNRIYSTMLQKVFPKYFRDIPWQKTGKPAGVTRKASIPVRAFEKGTRVFKKLFRIMPSAKGYTNYPTWIRDEDVACKLATLLRQDNARYRLMTEDDLAKRWLEPHLQNKGVNHSNQILRSATVEIYLRQVFGDIS